MGMAEQWVSEDILTKIFSYLVEALGGPKVMTQTFRLIVASSFPPEMPSFHQPPLEDFTKITQKFFNFCLFLSFSEKLPLIVHITIHFIFSDDWEIIRSLRGIGWSDVLIKWDRALMRCPNEVPISISNKPISLAQLMRFTNCSINPVLIDRFTSSFQDIICRPRAFS